MKYSKILLAVAAICALGLIIYFLPNGNKESPDQQPEPAQESPSQKPEGQQTSDAPAKEPAQKPALEIAGNSDTLTKLHEILLSADEFYKDTSKGAPLLTQNGFLYDVAADIVITPEYLIKREYLSKDYSVNGAVILYLMPEEVSEVIPFEDYGNELKLYVAAPYDGGYIVDTKSYSAVKISNDDFGRIISKYDIKHGEIRRLTGSSKEYPEINALIKEYEKSSDDFYIRYGMMDDKYAVVIASPKNSYESVYQYVLVLQNGEWEVKVPNLEAVGKARYIANSVCRDMDISLMPNYDVTSFMGYMIKDFSGVSEALIKDGYLEESNDKIKYISATTKYLFAKYENGQMFVGVNTNDLWVLGEVDSPDNALARIKGLDTRAPDFILIWE